MTGWMVNKESQWPMIGKLQTLYFLSTCISLICTQKWNIYKQQTIKCM